MVGAGIVGLATALHILGEQPGLSVLVVDKEPQVGAHQTSHNSGVIHRGIYYAPGSLKAQLCVEGARRLTAFCDERAIPYRLIGKLIVASDESELPALRELQRRGEANGVPGLRWLEANEIREIEPHAVGVAALHSPETGIVDFGAVVKAYAAEVELRGGTIRLAARVTALLAVYERSPAELGRRGTNTISTPLATPQLPICDTREYRFVPSDTAGGCPRNTTRLAVWFI